jgi:predicted RNase H-like HicB family nuclease
MKKKRAAVIARERTIDRLRADGESISKIARALGCDERVVRWANARRTGKLHRDRYAWLKAIIRRAANRGYDITEDDAFMRLFTNLTTFCAVHTEVGKPTPQFHPDLGCTKCIKYTAVKPLPPEQFPYRIKIQWSLAEGAYVATAPAIPELRVLEDTIIRAKRELQDVGLIALARAIDEGLPLPTSDLRKKVNGEIVFEPAVVTRSSFRSTRKKKKEGVLDLPNTVYCDKCGEDHATSDCDMPDQDEGSEDE